MLSDRNYCPVLYSPALDGGAVPHGCRELQALLLSVMDSLLCSSGFQPSGIDAFFTSVSNSVCSVISVTGSL